MSVNSINSIKYQSEIDGLRALAVVPVLLYHARIETPSGGYLAGGFLGVDVFFVISGYLITRLLLREFDEKGAISLVAFYERRMRRIMPPLLLVIITSFAPACFLLYAPDLERFAKSAFYSLAFVSNHFWHLELNTYGAVSTLFNPLVHLWSLAVEEQFYLFFPILLTVYLGSAFRLRPVIIIAALAVLFLLSAAVTRLDSDLSFYWLPSRAWELLAGAALASHRTIFSRAAKDLREGASAAGLIAILASYLFVSLESVAHPGLATLPVVVGAVLIIGCAGDDTIVGRLLSARPLVWIGLISYSLYLWHYPVMAFGRHLSFSPSLADKLGWIVVSVVLAQVTLVLVERPFRNRGRISLRPAAASIAMAALAVFVGAFVIAKQDGWPSRMAHLSAAYGQETHDNQKLRMTSWRPLRSVSQTKDGEVNNAFGPSPDEAYRLWFSPDETRMRVLIAGNSHAKDIYNAVSLGAYGEEMAPARFGLGIDLPEGQVFTLRGSPNYAAADFVVLAHSFTTDRMEAIEAFIEAVKSDGKSLIVLDKRPEFRTYSPYPLADQWFLSSDRSLEDNSLAKEAYRIAEFSEHFNRRLQNVAARHGAVFISQEELLCDLKARECPLLTPEKRKIMYDATHFTLQGAKHIGDRMAELDFFRP